MSTLYTQQSSNIQKTWMLIGLFFILIIAFGYVLSQYYGSPVILYVAVIFSIILNVASYWWSDKVALALSRAQPLAHDQDPDLYHIVENLSITAGLPMPRLYVINDPAPNAFATGRNKEHAAIAVTTGLRAMLDRSELEGVIAHELSHIGNRDILISTVIVVLAGVISISADFFTRSLWWGGDDRRGGGRAQGAMMIVGIVFAILAPLAATLIRLAISRKREFLADASGALLTRYPEGLASALRKISGYGRPMEHANNATAHLYISNPFGARGASGMAKLFMTHPPTEERITALLGEKAL
jgi:heat shock protein HtpX